MAHQGNDITGLGLSEGNSYAVCVVEVFLLNRVSVISAVTSAAAMDDCICIEWSLNHRACLQNEWYGYGYYIF